MFDDAPIHEDRDETGQLSLRWVVGYEKSEYADAPEIDPNKRYTINEGLFWGKDGPSPVRFACQLVDVLRKWQGNRQHVELVVKIPVSDIGEFKGLCRVCGWKVS